jgi:hypothetical protein
VPVVVDGIGIVGTDVARVAGFVLLIVRVVDRLSVIVVRCFGVSFARFSTC